MRLMSMSNVLVLIFFALLSTCITGCEKINNWKMEKGLSEFKSGNYEDAADWWMGPAEAKHPRAMSMLGQLYLHGDGVDKDENKGIDMVQNAADLGEPVAQSLMSHAYREGSFGKDINHTKALDYAEKSAKQNNPQGQVALGLIYHFGAGVERDSRKARDLFLTAAEAGNVKGMTLAAASYQGGEGVGKDLERAKFWYEKAVAIGGPDSGLALSGLGDLVSATDPERSIDLHKKAIQYGVTFSYVSLCRFALTENFAAHAADIKGACKVASDSGDIRSSVILNLAENMVPVPGLPYMVSKFETTTADFKLFVKQTGYVSTVVEKGEEIWRKDSNDLHPVRYVSRVDVDAYIDWVNELLNLTSEKAVQLPSVHLADYYLNAGFIYCRPYSDIWGGGNISIAPENIKEATGLLPVGSFPPNPIGIFDAGGNVEEYVKENRYIQWVGGSYAYEGVHAGSSHRWGNSWEPTLGDGFGDVGFRIVQRRPLTKDQSSFERRELVKIHYKILEAKREETQGCREVYALVENIQKNMVPIPVKSPAKGFAIGKYEVTYGENTGLLQYRIIERFLEWFPEIKEFNSSAENMYVKAVKNLSDQLEKERNPAVYLSFDDAQGYIAYINFLIAPTNPFRLPTVEEWVYAARGGVSTDFPWGSDIGRGKANCGQSLCADGYEYTSPVGSFAPNNFGLYDVTGNAFEWTSSCWEGNCSKRVLLGGSWAEDDPVTMSLGYGSGAAAGASGSNSGFRLAQDL